MTYEDSISAVIEEVGVAFSNLDFDRWLNCFHSPRTVIFPNSVFSSTSYEESKKALMPLFESLKAKGFKRTRLDLCNIKMLSGTTAIVSTVWARFDLNEKLLERLGATYLFLLTGNQWKIAVLTGHSPDVVVVETLPTRMTGRPPNAMFQ